MQTGLDGASKGGVSNAIQTSDNFGSQCSQTGNLPAQIQLPNGMVISIENLCMQIVVALGQQPVSSPLSTPPATFGWFLKTRFEKRRIALWRRKTRDFNRFLFNEVLIPKWGDIPLAEIDIVEVQAWLGKLAVEKSASYVDKCRVYMKAICAEAVEDDYLRKNPLRKLRMPVKLNKVDKSTLSAEQVRAMMEQLPNLRDRLIFRLFVIGGFRRQEVFALRWDDLMGQSLRVDETVEMSKVVDATKTKKSRGLVGVSRAILLELNEWREQSERTERGDFIFYSSVGTHMAPENWIREVLRPAAAAAGIGRINYQILRRTFATLAPTVGMSLKHISEQLRHCDITTTANEYMQPITSELLQGLDMLDSVFMGRK